MFFNPKVDDVEMYNPESAYAKWLQGGKRNPDGLKYQRKGQKSKVRPVLSDVSLSSDATEFDSESE